MIKIGTFSFHLSLFPSPAFAFCLFIPHPSALIPSKPPRLRRSICGDGLPRRLTVQFFDEEDYISLTDIARFKDSDRTDDLIRNWLRNRNTIEFVGIWEQLNNPAFNPVEFDGIKMQAGLNSFTLTPKQWIEKTGAIGIVSKTGRYGGTFAHKDIAFEFASWISVEFKLYLIKEFQRLKEQEQKHLGWDIKRNLAKIKL